MNISQRTHADDVASDPTSPPSATVVVTTACHLCEDAVSELVQRTTRGEIGLEVVSAESEQGQALLARHRPTMFPLVLLDGTYFSAGRLPRRKLDKVLTGGRAR